MTKYFIVSDIHGSFEAFKAVLKHWDRENETLVLMGDLIDRGEQSKEVLLHAYELAQAFDVRLIQGNHEELFLAFLSEPETMSGLYYGAGGRSTLYSFFGKEADRKMPAFLAKRFLKEYPHIVEWMSTAVPYIVDETNGWTNVFVHGGVDLTLDDWRDTPASDYAWMRREFIHAPNALVNTRFYFGHTPTYLINSDASSDVYISQDEKVGIDGGVWVSGVLHAVKVDGSQYELLDNKKSCA